MEIKIKELKGLKSVRALTVYTKLVLALGLTPYNKEGSITEFAKKFEEYPAEEKKVLLKAACASVWLEDDEIEAVTSFALDENNIAYESESLFEMKPSEIVKIMSEVCFKISETKIFF